MKIYTKTGDGGSTSLFGGQRVDKNSARIAAYGNVDELNSLIGVILANDLQKDISKKLLRIQAELFVLGSDLATPAGVKVKVVRVKRDFVLRLEREIDLWEKQLPILRNFILPGGSAIGSLLHLARTVARRAERSIVDLSLEEKINKNAISYINRLSDWLYVCARVVNKLDNVGEIPWQGRRSSRKSKANG